VLDIKDNEFYKFIFDRIKLKETIVIRIDWEIAEMFGTEFKEYFWEWIEGRMPEGAEIRIEFIDWIRIYQDRKQIGVTATTYKEKETSRIILPSLFLNKWRL
jgi:hypothetical protein